MDKKILCHHVGILLVACLLPSVSPSTGSRPGLLPFAKAAHSFRHRDLPRPTKETEGKGMPETDNESLMFCESCGKRDVSILYRIRGRKRRTFLVSSPLLDFGVSSAWYGCRISCRRNSHQSQLDSLVLLCM